ncbi:glyoxylase-like metal-dependent hydrolase (beta-lactamase superfamily II) [Bradyrhizobium japonicum]|uniref:MBL fold metallo-hydrolase n=1 Tax=Bradyrhizobium japonicum TaxID=375 RepID=UPI003396FFF1
MSPVFRSADLTIYRIIESEGSFLPALAMFPELTSEMLDESRSWMRQVGALDDQDAVRVCIQSYVIKTPHHNILVDTCVGNDKPRPKYPTWHMKTDNTYMTALRQAGLDVEDIDIVMCTHLHVDHVGWNTRLDGGRWKPTFPNAKYVFSKAELDHWTTMNAKTPEPVFEDSVLPIVEAGRADVVGDDFQVGDHLRILPTPGHTPGHIALMVGRNKDEAVFSGDLMHSPLQTLHPDLSPRFDFDPIQAARTRRAFLERYCDTDTLCCTAHFPSPSYGRIRRRKTGFICEMT